MRFAGLFDCKSTKAHGEAVLVYEKNNVNFRKNSNRAAHVSRVLTDDSHKYYAEVRVPILNPLNYATTIGQCSNTVDTSPDTECKEGYIPITELHSNDNHNTSGIYFYWISINNDKCNITSR